MELFCQDVSWLYLLLFLLPYRLDVSFTVYLRGISACYLIKILFVQMNSRKSHGPLVKICGIRRPSDAEAAVEAGADWIGVNLYSKSKRFLDFKNAESWLLHFANRCQRVVVLVQPTLDEIRRIWDSGAVDMIQLHGREPLSLVEQVASLQIPIIYAIPSQHPPLDPTSVWRMTCQCLLVDATSSSGFGGTGVKIPLANLLGDMTCHSYLPVVVAGGLNPENVAEVARIPNVYGVDVAGGVEDAEGFKSPEKMKRFVEAAKFPKSYSQEA